MFDFENPFEDVQVKEQVPCDTDSVNWDEADWEQITADHADDAKEVSENFECGLGIDKFNDIKEQDIIECYIMEEIRR